MAKVIYRGSKAPPPPSVLLPIVVEKLLAIHPKVMTRDELLGYCWRRLQAMASTSWAEPELEALKKALARGKRDGTLDNPAFGYWRAK